MDGYPSPVITAENNEQLMGHDVYNGHVRHLPLTLVCQSMDFSISVTFSKRFLFTCLFVWWADVSATDVSALKYSIVEHSSGMRSDTRRRKMFSL